MPKFYCTYCGQHINASEDLAGSKSICPSCGKEIDVPHFQSDHIENIASDSPEPTVGPDLPKIPTDPGTSFSTKMISLLGSAVFVLVVLFLSRSCGAFMGKQAAEKELAKRSSTQSHPPINNNSPSKVDFDSILPEIVSRINKNMPMMIDRDTRADRISSGPGRKVTYHCSLTRLRSSDIDRNYMLTTLREKLIEGYKNQAVLKYFRENNVAIDYSYVDMNGTHVATISITPEDTR